MADGVVDHELRRCEDRLLAHIVAVMLQVRQGRFAHKFIEHVTAEIEGPKNLECQSEGFGSLSTGRDLI